MDIERAQEEFIKYTDNYDSHDKNIALKIYHTLRVMKLSNSIALSLGLDEEQVKLAGTIGLLHDIGRFEQIKQYGTFVDSLSFDHGDFGAELLSDKSFLHKFISTNKYDNVIIAAVRNHNKYNIEDGLTDEELLHCKIVRDADKLDILFESIDLLWDDDLIYKIENAPCISEKYFNQVKTHKQFLREKGTSDNKLNSIVIKLSFVFDINFDYSFKHIYENDYINKIVDKFNFKNPETKEQIEEIRKITNEYVKSKISL